MGLGELVKETIEKAFETIIGKLGEWFFPSFLAKLKEEVALKTLDESLFRTEEVKEAVKKLKEEWKKSPETASEAVQDVMKPGLGFFTEAQLESITNVKVDETVPYTQKIFKQIALITDIALFSSILSEVAEFLSMGQVDHIGREIRAYLDYSGLAQVTGYGYGMILNSLLSPLLTKEINLKTRPEILPIYDAIRMNYRGIITDDELKEQLGKHGLSDELIEKLKADYKYMPTPNEVISWLAREVFEPEMIEKWRLDEGFEEVKGRELFYQRGIDDEMIRNYWIAHWEHPDFYRIKTLVNREKLKEEDIAEWCKLVEIAPVWADEMWELMWDDLTRVDVRRIYELGYRDDEWLKKQLTRVGYKDENLKDMMEFYKRYKMRNYFSLLEEIYKEEYEAGKISYDDYVMLLKEIGYTDAEADAIAYLTTIKMGSQTKGELLNTARKLQKATKEEEVKELPTEIIEKEKELRRLEEEREKAVKEKKGPVVIQRLNQTIADLRAEIEKAYK